MFAVYFKSSLISGIQKTGPFWWSFFRKVRPVSNKINTPFTVFRNNKYCMLPTEDGGLDVIR